MKIFSWDEITKTTTADFTGTFDVAGTLRFSGTALTVGGFDGPHNGHRYLCTKITEKARMLSLSPGVITFTRSPRSFKQHGAYAGDISTLRLRLKILAQWGFAFAVVIDFSADFSKMEGTEFLRILKDCCAMRFFGVGKGFRCGRSHAVGETLIRSFAETNGIGCEFVPLENLSGSRISSSSIRDCIVAGELEQAARLLGRPFEIDCHQFTVKERSGTRFVLEPCNEGLFQILPPSGMYPVRISAVSGGKDVCFCTSLHTDASVLRLDAPDADKDYRFDTIRF